MSTRRHVHSRDAQSGADLHRATAPGRRTSLPYASHLLEMVQRYVHLAHVHGEDAYRQARPEDRFLSSMPKGIRANADRLLV